MIHKLIHKMHDFMLSQMMEWCGSYQTMVITMWICLIAMFYAFFMLLFKTVRLGNKEVNYILSTICRAIEQNDVVKCVKLLEKYPHCINRFTKDGYTPFLIACATGNTQLVKVMLKKGKRV